MSGQREATALTDAIERVRRTAKETGTRAGHRVGYALADALDFAAAVERVLDLCDESVDSAGEEGIPSFAGVLDVSEVRAALLGES